MNLCTCTYDGLLFIEVDNDWFSFIGGKLKAVNRPLIWFLYLVFLQFLFSVSLACQESARYERVLGMRGGRLSWIPTAEQVVSCSVCSELCGQIHHRSSPTRVGPLLLIKPVLSEQDGLSERRELHAADRTALRRTPLIRTVIYGGPVRLMHGDKFGPAPVSFHQQGALRS